MGTYLSIPYLSRKVVHVEPTKSVKTDNVADTVTSYEEVKDEDAKKLVKDEDVKEEMKELMKEENTKEEEIKESVKEENTKEEEIKESVKEENTKEEEIKESVKEENTKEKEDTNEEKTKEVKEVKDEVKKEFIKEEVVMPEFLPKQPSIPSESEVLPDLSEKVLETPRIPEFQGNMNSASHAIKKFNRRHRKHQH